MAISEHDWKTIEHGLQTVAHLVGALQRRMVEKGRDGITATNMERALEGISDCLPMIDATDYDE